MSITAVGTPGSLTLLGLALREPRSSPLAAALPHRWTTRIPHGYDSQCGLLVAVVQRGDELLDVLTHEVVAIFAVDVVYW